MNAYILAFAVLLVTLGRFGDLRGRRKLFVIGMALFIVGSAACGLAPDIYLLIAFRVLQGIGGAAMMPATLSIVSEVFPPGKRGAAMGVWGGVSGLATAIGPTLGGILVQYATWPTVEGSWRWTFHVTIPIGIVGVILALRIVPESRNPTAVESLDLPGVGLVTVSLFALTFALIEGQDYGWTSGAILGLFVVAAAFAVFNWREHRVRQPLIDFSLFRSLNFAAGNATGLLLSAAMMGAFFIIPIFLQSVLGYSAIKAGLMMAPMSVIIIFAAPLAGSLSDRLGSKWIVVAGMFLLAAGLAWMAGLLAAGRRLGAHDQPGHGRDHRGPPDGHTDFSGAQGRDTAASRSPRRTAAQRRMTPRPWWYREDVGGGRTCPGRRRAPRRE